MDLLIQPVIASDESTVPRIANLATFTGTESPHLKQQCLFSSKPREALFFASQARAVPAPVCACAANRPPAVWIRWHEKQNRKSAMHARIRKTVRRRLVPEPLSCRLTSSEWTTSLANTFIGLGTSRST